MTCLSFASHLATCHMIQKFSIPVMLSEYHFLSQILIIHGMFKYYLYDCIKLYLFILREPLLKNYFIGRDKLPFFPAIFALSLFLNVRFQQYYDRRKIQLYQPKRKKRKKNSLYWIKIK